MNEVNRFRVENLGDAIYALIDTFNNSKRHNELWPYNKQTISLNTVCIMLNSGFLKNMCEKLNKKKFEKDVKLLFRETSRPSFAMDVFDVSNSKLHKLVFSTRENYTELTVDGQKEIGLFSTSQMRDAFISGYNAGKDNNWSPNDAFNNYFQNHYFNKIQEDAKDVI